MSAQRFTEFAEYSLYAVMTICLVTMLIEFLRLYIASKQKNRTGKQEKRIANIRTLQSEVWNKTANRRKKRELERLERLEYNRKSQIVPVDSKDMEGRGSRKTRSSMSKNTSRKDGSKASSQKKSGFGQKAGDGDLLQKLDKMNPGNNSKLEQTLDANQSVVSNGNIGLTINNNINLGSIISRKSTININQNIGGNLGNRRSTAMSINPENMHKTASRK